jgi:hypothetical protein
LNCLAEVKTLAGSCTLSSHFFADTRQPGQILVRDVACLNYASCSKLGFVHCDNKAMCGSVFTCQVELVSGARTEQPVSRSSIQCNGLLRAKSVRDGMMVGSENTEEKEPYIISRALGSEQVWAGDDGESWNGTIKAGDKYIRARKLHKMSAVVYDESDIIFHLNSEDVRVENIPAVDHSRPALRNQALNKSYKFVEKDIELLKSRVYVG